MRTVHPVQSRRWLVAVPEGARFIGVDAGAETIKLIELQRNGTELSVTRWEIVEHGKKPGPALVEALQRWNWDSATGAAVCGRFAGQINLPPVPLKHAQVCGYRFLFGDEPATLVSIGSHSFSVLAMRPLDVRASSPTAVAPGRAKNNSGASCGNR